MSDDQLNASELRKRYHRGGTIPDSDLSASQLRGRYGIENNGRTELGVLLTARRFIFNQPRSDSGGRGGGLLLPLCPLPPL